MCDHQLVCSVGVGAGVSVGVSAGVGVGADAGTGALHGCGRAASVCEIILSCAQ